MKTLNTHDLGFDVVTVASVTELREKFPALPPRVLVTLWLVTMLERSVTPHRLCQCGCGEFVTGKERTASAACRKRVQRERDALKRDGVRQFRFPLQFEIPVSIPAVTPAPRPSGVSMLVSTVDTSGCDKLSANETSL